MIKSPSKLFIYAAAVNNGILSLEETRERLKANNAGLIMLDSGVEFRSMPESRTIRRAIACKNCGSTQYENDVCSFCGTIYEGGKEK